MLNNKVRLYIPSTNDVSSEISQSEFNARALEVAKQFAIMFGGFSIVDTVGGWVAESGDTVVENIKVVESYCTTEQLEKYLANVTTLAESKREEWKQEAISLETITPQGQELRFI